MNDPQREAPEAGDPTPANEPSRNADASSVAVANRKGEALPQGSEAAGATEGAGNDRRRNRNRRRGRRGGAEAGDGPQGVPIEVAVLVGEDGEPVVPTEPTAAPEEAAPLEAPSAGDRFADVISGAYDSESAEEAVSEPAATERRVLAPEPDAPKLHKVLAQAGVGSRRDMEQLIADGRIVVNGEVAHVGQRITAGDQVRVDGKIVRLRIMPPPARVLAYHKPAGEIVTHGDPQNRPTVFRKLPRLPHGKWQSVGRLDMNTEGLLLFTNSGELANQLMHPRFGIEREYAVRVLGKLDDEAKEQLLEGVDIEGQRAAFQAIEDGGGEGANHWYRVVINEGRNREVRNLFAAVGLTVSRLIRIRYGCVVLPRGLKRGVWVDLPDRDVGALKGLLGMRRQQPQQGMQGNDKGNRRRGRRGRGGREGERSPERPVEPRVPGHDHDIADFGAIPNPLQQTYDRRAIREARQPRREYAEDGPIPNPLEQTYDKRFVQKQRGPGGGRKGGGDNSQRQPDPMQTSVGYIGADAFHKKMAGGGGGGGGRGRRRR